MPAATAVALLSPLTVTGVLRLAKFPSPSWPNAFHPQHLTVPLASRAQVWYPPAATAVAPLSPLTVTGVVRLVSVPSPSWPYPFHPQHLTVLSPSRAQV